MGERDLGSKTSMQRDREGPPGDREGPLGERGDADGTINEVLPEEELEDREDEDLEEARRADRHDTADDDYVQDDSDYRGVIDEDPGRAADRIDADERAAHTRPIVRRAPPPRP